MDKAEIQTAILKLSPFERDQLRQWLDTKQQIEEVTESVVRLTQYHTIWWEIMRPDTAREFDDVRREYLDFLETVCHAFFQGFYIGAYQLLDQRSDSKHIHSLIEALSMNDQVLASKLKSQISAYSGASKVKLIRHKIFAHRDRFLSPNQVLATAPIQVKEMKGTLVFIQDIVAKVVAALSGDEKIEIMKKFSICEDSARDAAFQVLEALNRDLKGRTAG
jgi:hypothetical protein